MPGFSRISNAIFIDTGTNWRKYVCPKCQCLLRDAVQPSCGHWLCQSCAKELFSTDGGSPRCPRQDCQEELVGEDGVNFFPDIFVRKEILNYNVVCLHHDEGCTWKGIFRNYEKHLSEDCQYDSKPCKHCKQQFSGSELECHEETCSLATKQCPLADLGCPEKQMMQRNEMADHLGSKEGLVDHLTMIATAISKSRRMYLSSDSMPARPPAEGRSNDGYTSPLFAGRDWGDDVEADSGSRLKKRAGELSHKRVDEVDGIGQKAFTDIHAVVGVDAGVDIGLGAMFDPRSDVKLQSMLQAFRDGMERSLKGELAKKDEEITSLKASVTKLEKLVRSKNSEIEDRDFRLSLIENSSYDGNMVWKIPQFSQRMTDAENGKYTSIFSLPFYTSRYGFKMCLRLYILGDGIGKNTHMSLFFVIMRGEFDNILQWPFTHKVTFKLLNQTGGRDILDTFQPDPMSSSFKKPKSDMNIASGCPRFVSHQDLKNSGFILDDTIFIRCTVDQSTIRHL